MKRFALVAAVMAACLPAAMVQGAGDVIGVTVADGRLVVSNGLLDAIGFADRMFVEEDEDGLPANPNINLPGFGQSVEWKVPGFNITGMAEDSGLFLQTLALPVKDSSPAINRALWYWNPISQQVETAPTENHFLIRKSASLGTFLTSTTSTDSTPLRFAVPNAGEMGLDNYSLLSFALHRATPPPAGAYGFFARLTSSQYAPSDPFLVVVNYNVDTWLMGHAAELINAAVENTLDGDFNGDGRVDAADYTVWRDGLGTTYNQDHYTEWKDNFGQGSVGSLSEPECVMAVPEPGGICLFASGAVSLLAYLACGKRDKMSANLCRLAPF